MRVQRSFVSKGEQILWILIYFAPSWKSQGALTWYDFRKSLSSPNRAPQSAILISCRAGIALKKDKDRLATELSIMLHAPAGLWCTVASWMIRLHPTLCCFAHACPHLKQSNILVTSLLETTTTKTRQHLSSMCLSGRAESWLATLFMAKNRQMVNWLGLSSAEQLVDKHHSIHFTNWALSIIIQLRCPFWSRPKTPICLCWNPFLWWVLVCDFSTKSAPLPKSSGLLPRNGDGWRVTGERVRSSVV